MSSIDKYFALRKEIDNLTENLFRLHKLHVKCLKGCSLCCENFSVLPVEFHAIQHEISVKTLKTEVFDEKSCKFLKNNECTIYNSRPIICRTQGLPLLFMSEDYNFEISICELNFKDFDFEEFNNENTFLQDTYNSKLFMLNKEFVQKSEIKYSGNELISLNNL
jgi:Fe-S-cluster containining protein